MFLKFNILYLFSDTDCCVDRLMVGCEELDMIFLWDVCVEK